MVLAVLACPGAASQPLLLHLPPQVAGPRGKAGNAVDRVDDEVKAIEVVEHDHVEGRGGRAFLLVAAHVEIAGGSRAGRRGGG